MRHFVVSFFLLVTSLMGHAQFNYLDTVYVRLDSLDYEYAKSSVKLSEDKFILTSYGNNITVLHAVCIDLAGDTLWTRKFRFDTLQSLYVYGSTLDSQKNLIIGGNGYNTISSQWVGILIKLDTSGNLIWVRDYSDSSFNEYAALDGQFPIITRNNNYLLVCANGVSSGIVDFYVVKTDTNGNEIRSWQYDNVTSYDLPVCGIQASDGGFVFAGFSNKFDTTYHYYPCIYVIKSDSSGNKQWETGIRSLYADSFLVGDAKAEAMLEVSDGYIVAGERGFASDYGYDSSNNAMGWEKFWLAKISKTNGQIIWDHFYGTDSASAALFHDIRQTTDGGYIMCGDYNFGDNTLNAGYVVRTDNLGNAIWTTIIQHPLNPTYYTDQMELHKIFNINGGFLVTGFREPGFPLQVNPFPYAFTIDSTGCWEYGCSSITGIKEIIADADNASLLV